MKRRSISLFPASESMVRDLQARMLTRLDRDVSFTEAINMMLLGCMMKGGAEFIMDKVEPELMTVFLESTNLNEEAVIDIVQDKYGTEYAKKMVKG